MSLAQTERVPTNLRMLLLLEALGDADGPMTTTELGRAIGLPKQTVHRLCNTMIDEGFLLRDEQGRGLRAGRRARNLASSILHTSSVHFVRRRVLEQLAAEVGETINFVVPEDQGMSYHDRVETDWPFRIQFAVGSHVPFHCTASGKTYLATLPAAERKRIAAVMDLKAQTANTITTTEGLIGELNRVKKQGFALDNEEFIEGMVAASVPVVGASGRYVASLACHGPLQRFNLEDAERLVPQLKKAAAQLTEALY